VLSIPSRIRSNTGCLELLHRHLRTWYPKTASVVATTADGTCLFRLFVPSRSHRPIQRFLADKKSLPSVLAACRRKDADPDIERQARDPGMIDQSWSMVARRAAFLSLDHLSESIHLPVHKRFSSIGCSAVLEKPSQCKTCHFRPGAPRLLQSMANSLRSFCSCCSACRSSYSLTAILSS